MLSFQTIKPNTLVLLKGIFSIPEIQGMRLVGGTSLALQLGHRSSVDLDFFSHGIINQDKILQALNDKWNVVVVNRSESILQVSVDGIKVDFVQYKHYDWIDLPVIEDGIVMASPKDIAAMKINAVIGRGSKKDFVDIFQLLKIYSFADIMGFYHQKYPEYSDYMALRSVVYFEDAEPQEMPELFISENWSQMKKTIINAVKTFQL